MKRLLKLTVVLALSSLGLAAPAAAGPPPAPPGLPVYLALGDSMANGQDSEAPGDIDAYWAQVAIWRSHGYVAPLRAYLAEHLDCLPAKDAHAADGCAQLNTVNLGRSAVPSTDTTPGLPGVTSALLIAEQLPEAEEMLSSRNHDANPRNDVELVTLSVGGNELFDALSKAQETGDPDAIQQAFTTFATNYGQILARLRAAAGESTPIITMTYFNPLPYCGFPGDSDTLKQLGTWILEMQPTGLPYPGYNGIIRTISAAYGAIPADTFGLLGEGDFFDCRHPDADGYAKILGAFEAAWAEATATP